MFQNKGLKSRFPCQEDRLGAEQVSLVKILQAFGVVVRGGPEDGKKLVTALLVCCPLRCQRTHLSLYLAEVVRLN